MAATQKKKQQEGPAPQVEARIDRMVDGDYKTKAYASVTIAGAFAVHGLRVIETDKGRFISMPQESYKKNGETVYNEAAGTHGAERGRTRSGHGTADVSATVRKEVTELGAIHRG